MKTYTVHFPKNSKVITEQALVDAVLIKDGFSWGAFFFGPFWMFWNRLWLAGFVYLSILICFFSLLHFMKFNPLFSDAANFLMMILIGLEARTVQRWTFERRGMPIAGIVSGNNQCEAEEKLIARGLERRTHSSSDFTSDTACDRRSSLSLNPA